MPALYERLRISITATERAGDSVVYPRTLCMHQDEVSVLLYERLIFSATEHVSDSVVYPRPLCMQQVAVRVLHCASLYERAQNVNCATADILVTSSKSEFLVVCEVRAFQLRQDVKASSGY